LDVAKFLSSVVVIDIGRVCKSFFVYVGVESEYIIIRVVLGGFDFLTTLVLIFLVSLPLCISVV